MVFDTSQSEYGDGRDDDKCHQNRPKSVPRDVTTQPPYDSSRGRDCQQPWESSGLAIAWQEERQHRHDEDAESEARGTLDETCADAQQEYG